MPVKESSDQFRIRIRLGRHEALRCRGRSDRRRAQLDPLPASGCIERYFAGHFVPSGRIGAAQALAFSAAGASWCVLARRSLRPRLRALAADG
ncbi:hypothetical protein BST31_15645 [Mycobacterium marseillense]|nr:hypothetical protein BST31_15645 [Mycobacterium marseillense]